ncbi:uncharacterized protein LOC114344218 [Diabrotica virgifera virgifera]|uniref:Bypass of stop codon protein 1-like n=1 Tax=Diabrotica virgifera virgifera TaxID=50390 RepID=A0A6P7GXS0_DIAVI|nr:uncharacterized protein LOC114344218 [Diabrotica virgifera virgifera]
MYTINVLVIVFLCIGLCQGYFKIIADDGDLTCRPSGVECLTASTFTTCTNIGSVTSLHAILRCPDGYHCDDSTSIPCKPSTEGSTTSSTITSSSTEISSSTSTRTTDTPNSTSSTITSSSTEEDITTSSTVIDTSTTKKKVPRPSGPPQCTAVGLYPAPRCNQYYECVQSTYLIFWTTYTAELRTCIDGDYYDTERKQCILASLSDCE